MNTYFLPLILKVDSLGLQLCYSSSLWTQKEPIGPKQLVHKNLLSTKIIDKCKISYRCSRARSLIRNTFFIQESRREVFLWRKCGFLFVRLIENKGNEHARSSNSDGGRELTLQKRNRDLSSSNSQDVILQINSALHRETVYHLVETHKLNAKSNDEDVLPDAYATYPGQKGTPC